MAETGQWIVRELNCNWHTLQDYNGPKHLHSNVLLNILEESIKNKKVNVNLLKDTMDSEIEKYRLETQFNNEVLLVNKLYK